MVHAEKITDRILLLDGLPNYQRIGSLRVGQTLREQFEADLAIEYEVVARLKPAIVLCREKQDSTTAILFEEIMADEEHHIDYLETQPRVDEHTWRGAVRGAVRVAPACLTKHRMSRIRPFADDDVVGWVARSPELGRAMAALSNAVYSRNRLPLRVREIARAVMAQDNECVVCMNTRDADGRTRAWMGAL